MSTKTETRGGRKNGFVPSTTHLIALRQTFLLETGGIHDSSRTDSYSGKRMWPLHSANIAFPSASLPPAISAGVTKRGLSSSALQKPFLMSDFYSEQTASPRFSLTPSCVFNLSRYKQLNKLLIKPRLMAEGSRRRFPADCSAAKRWIHQEGKEFSSPLFGHQQPHGFLRRFQK